MKKEEIFRVLNDWNYWDKEIPITYPRKFYEEIIKKYDKTEEITILKGIRRCGKSTLFTNHIKNLLKNGINKKEILIINFEDPRFIENHTTKILDEILEVYNEYISDKKPYLFLDEVQNIEMWEKWVRTSYELKKVKKLYVTGSSSKLLSKEFGTALSGRYLDIDVFPLSFREYLEFRNEKIPNLKEMITNKIKYKRLFNSYTNEGGFPKVVLSDTDLKKKEILVYYDSIILKDIVARYNLKNSENVKKVSFFLISNIGKPINLNNIKKALNISYELVEKYFEYLKDTFMIFEVNRYEYSLKKQFFSYKKIYSCDLAFNNYVGFQFKEDIGRLLENLVFLELKRRNYEIYYYTSKNGHECDFVIKEGLKITQAIQVTKEMTDEKTRQREFKGLIEAMKELKLESGLILTENEEDEVLEDGFKIKIIPIWKWLLN
jgi:uncharacterized protein